MEVAQLDVPQDEVRGGGEREAQLEADVTAVRSLTGLQGDGTDPPLLAHARHHSCDTTAEGADGCDARRQALGMVVELWVVAAHAALEHEVIGQGDSLVDGCRLMLALFSYLMPAISTYRASSR